MRDDRVRFQSGEWEIEGLYHHGLSEKGAVICHPHPLYGGDMYNPVVEAVAAAYQKNGFATLRFNFRGTGKSTGTYDRGKGERIDVAAAVKFLEDEGLAEVHLSGYSFGAWVNAMASEDGLAVQGMTMVAPPVAFIDFKDNIRLPMLSTVLAGSRDEFAPPELIRKLMGQWNPHAHMEIIDDADHFFFGFLDQVTARLAHQL